MSLAQHNPFNKPNPFKSNHYEKYQPTSQNSSSTKDYSHFVYHDSHKLQYHRMSNNWSFNQNNLSKKVDFSRKYQPKVNQASQFEIRMRASSVFTLPNNQSRVLQLNEGKISNPFQRKNLLVDRQAVNKQVEADLTNYRLKTSSVYEPAQRISYGSVKFEESPIMIAKPSNQRYSYEYMQITKSPEVQIYPPYDYSKAASQNSERQNNPQKSHPKTLQYKRKTFYLNNQINK